MAEHHQNGAQGTSSWRPSTTLPSPSRHSEEPPRKKLKPTTSSTPITSPETQQLPPSITETDITMTGTDPEEDTLIRTHRINTDLINLFARPVSNTSRSISTSTHTTTNTSHPASIKGIGLYTHIEGSKPTPRFPHQRYTTGPLVFLPLMDATRGANDKAFAHNEKAQKVWQEIKAALLEEEKQSKIPDTSRDPRKIYAPLGVPKVEVSSAENQVQIHSPTRQAQVPDAELKRKDSMASDHSLQERRLSSTSTSMSIAGIDAQSRRPSLQSPGDDAPRSATETNMYDAARDPRLRRR